MSAVLAVLLVASGASPAQAAAPTTWGTAGAQYSGGVLCTLDGPVRVPMATWLVGGQQAFATDDVVGSVAGDGPAPVGGTLAPIADGDVGLDDRGIAVLAYLIAHHGQGSPADTAEVSALVATAAGGGGVQTTCLGQQGTSAAAAAALRAEAESYAGPYQLDVTAPSAGPPGSAATVRTTVLSATGVPVPGLDVTVTAAGQTITSGTDAQGVATASLVTPAVASSPVTATVAQPSLLYAADTTPTAIALGPATVATGTATLSADLHPRPVLHIDVGGGLEPVQAQAAIAARITGTYGFPGTGTVTLAGPAAPGADGSCTSLPSSAYAAAPAAWSQTFNFTGDGAEPVGSTPQLAAGCYVAGGSITVSGVTPTATAGAPFEQAAIIDVVRLAVRRSTVPLLALPGRVSTTVTVDGVDNADVSSGATVYGPATPVGGRCDAVSWTGAAVAGTADRGPQPASGDAQAVVLRTPQLSALGCYAIRASTTVTLDGRSLTVQPDLGAAGTVVLVMQPKLAIADDRYDTTRGTPMTGQVTVTGTYGFPATVSVRLRSAAPHYDGCRSVSFPTAASAAVTVARTQGDGTVAIRTPPPDANTCYAIEASLRMSDVPSVQVAGPAPSAATVFLAGQVTQVQQGPDVVHHPGSMLRAGIGLLVSVLLMLAVAGAVIVRTALRGRHVGGGSSGGPRPDGGILLPGLH